MKKIRVLALALVGLVFSTVPALGQASAASGGSSASVNLASVSAIAVDLASGETRVDKHADWQLPIASITKLMTALVVLEAGQPLDESLTIVEREHEIFKNAYSRMRIGSALTRDQLLRIMLMSSENLAAHVLAVNYPGGRDGFIAAMNDRARALGMTRSRFVDPSGLSPENVSTASDLVRLLQATYRDPRIRAYSTTPSHSAQFTRPRYVLGYGNTNPLVSSGRWDVSVSKTGYLREAGRCLAMVTTIDGRTVAMVMLDSFGTRTPLGDAGRIRRWLTSGDTGSVAGAALDYEQRRTVERAGAQSDDYHRAAN